LICQRLMTKLLLIIAIALVNLNWIEPVAAVTQNLQLSSKQGYRVETSFSYDEDSANKAIAVPGKEITNEIDALQVRFYNPEGDMIASYDNIIDGVVQGDYFEFHYDPVAQQLRGAVDLGGESAGEIYLKGDIEQELALIEVEPSGEERTMENGEWTISR
ncbi:MAG: hypothetical protein AAFR62_02300, partial [Cyanobacteria bacterium J06629_2]